MKDKHDLLLKHLRGVQCIVINTCHGGFNLSLEAIKRYHELKNQQIWIETNRRYSRATTIWLVPQEQRLPLQEGESWEAMTDQEKQDYNNLYDSQTWHCHDLARDDPALVQVVRELGKKANDRFASLKIVEIPATVDWVIQEYDGKEWVAERHRIWD